MQLVIFDLDGTLVDSFEDIARSVNETLESLGRPSLPHDAIRGFVGNGVQKLLERALRTTSPRSEPSEPSKEAVLEAVSLYLPVYRRRLLDATRPYPGVVDALDALDREGDALAVLTNKPVQESRMILDGLGLGRYFRAVHGGDSFDRKKPDPVGVLHLLSETGARRERTLFVGDSSVDLQTARNASVPSCLVTHGAAAPRELRADWVIAELGELFPLVHPASG